MKTRILTSILIILVVLYPVAFGGIALQLLGAFLVIAGSYEWSRNLSGYKTWGIPLTCLLIAWLLGLGFVSGAYLMPYCIAGLIIFWSMPIFVPSFTLEDSMKILAFMAIMGLAYLSMQKIYLQYHYLWTLCFATYGSDTGAYFAGRFFGKHKMIERISPKKTWEGFFGGWIAGFLLSFGLSFLYGQSLNPTLNLLLCVFAPVFAELGDLCFSAYKRDGGIKDFSNLLPGHGGVLDRVDSLLMNFLLFGMLVSLF